MTSQNHAPGGGENRNDRDRRQSHQESEVRAGQPAPQTEQSGEQASGEELQGQIAELRDRLLRELAEQENIRMHARRDKDEAVSYAASDFAKDVVGSLDNLRRAINSFPSDLAGDPSLKGVLEGLEATERALLDTFERHGITRLQPVGELFDPNRHDALQLTEDSDQPPGTIIEVLQPGYLYHDRLLRPAKVNVARG
ncbi:MAG: nucleotide exchange factor GrpE [Rhodomicrobium sp.]